MCASCSSHRSKHFPISIKATTSSKSTHNPRHETTPHCSYRFSRCPVLISVLMVMALCLLANSQDKDPFSALRNTLSSLCKINKGGDFGFSCMKYNIDSIIDEESPELFEFVDDISVIDGNFIERLFVLYFLFLFS